MGFGKSLYNVIRQYSEFYFGTIAITLGTGVLALPITLSKSGFLPFLVTILLSYFVQVLTLLFFTEVLQKAYYRNIANLPESDKDNEPINIETQESPTYGSDNDLAAKRGSGTETIKRCLPNLHSLGELFLPYFLPHLSTLTIIFEMIVFLTSFTLAGSQAFAILTGVQYYKVIAVFCWSLALVIILLNSVIGPIISILTFFKGVCFTGTVFVAFVIGVKTQNPVSTDFSAIGDSFLMSAISLGAFVNMMPMMFGDAKQTREGIIGYNLAIFLGLTTCVFLNILWCWSVLAIVPQTSVCLSNNINETIQMSLNLFNDTQPQGQCISSPSLANSAANGEISTVPLSVVLQSKQIPSFDYVSVLIQLFVAISVSVSFITVGSVLYHTTRGVVDSYWSPPSAPESKYGKFSEYFSVQQTRHWFLSLMTFAVIFVIAYSNPKSFKVIVEQAGSFFTNVKIGIFFAIMIHKATSSKYNSYILPFQLPRWLLPFQYIIPIYYLSAFIYNFYITNRNLFFLNK